MKLATLFAPVAAALMLAACQHGGVGAHSHARLLTAEVTTASPPPFRPGPRLQSARFVPPDRYYGFGGGYSTTAPDPALAAVDTGSLLLYSDRCGWRHWNSFGCAPRFRYCHY